MIGVFIVLYYIAQICIWQTFMALSIDILQINSSDSWQTMGLLRRQVYCRCYPESMVQAGDEERAHHSNLPADL